MADKIQSKITLGKYFSDPDPKVLHIQSVDTDNAATICLIWGGPSFKQEGAVGLFDPDGKLMDQRYVDGLMHAYPLPSSQPFEHSPKYIALVVMDRYGAGDWDQSLVVLAAYKNRLIEVWRGSGDAVHASANTFFCHAGLVLMDLDDDAADELIWTRYENADEGVTPSGKFQTEAFRFDSEKLRFVPMMK